MTEIAGLASLASKLDFPVAARTIGQLSRDGRCR